MNDDTQHSLTLRVPPELIENIKNVAQLNTRSLRGEIEVAMRKHVERYQYFVFLEENGRRTLVERCLALAPEMAILEMTLKYGAKQWIVEPAGDGRSTVTVRVPHGIRTAYIDDAEIRDKGINTVLAQIRTR